MSRIPDFANVTFAAPALPQPAGAPAPWMTPEGIAVKPAYGPRDLEGLDFLAEHRGAVPSLAELAALTPADFRAYLARRAADDLIRPILFRSILVQLILRGAGNNGYNVSDWFHHLANRLLQHG